MNDMLIPSNGASMRLTLNELCVSSTLGSGDMKRSSLIGELDAFQLTGAGFRLEE